MSPSSRETADIERIEAEAAAYEAAGGVDAAELESIVTTIAESPIVVEPVPPTFALSDWESVRHSPNADEFILAWIASHVRPRRATSLA
jgi:hypothetical protein